MQLSKSLKDDIVDFYVERYVWIDLIIVCLVALSFIFLSMDKCSVGFVLSKNFESLLNALVGSSLSLAGFSFASYTIFTSFKWTIQRNEKQEIPTEIDIDDLDKYLPDEQQLRNQAVDEFLEGKNLLLLLRILRGGVKCFLLIFLSGLVLMFASSIPVLFYNLLVILLSVWSGLVILRTLGLSLGILKKIFENEHQ